MIVLQSVTKLSNDTALCTVTYDGNTFDFKIRTTEGVINVVDTPRGIHRLIEELHESFDLYQDVAQFIHGTEMDLPVTYYSDWERDSQG